jgi:hypothetical protein
MPAPSPGVWVTRITCVEEFGVVFVRCRSIDLREPLKIHISSQLPRCVKNFLLTYTSYAALQNFFRALHLGEL